jgi:ankyrin repeat protein
MDVNTKNKHGTTALHIAALSISDNNDMIKLLVKAGADLMAIDRNGFTLLHCAAYKGHFAILVELLEAGSDGILDDKLLKLLSADSNFS